MILISLSLLLAALTGTDAFKVGPKQPPLLKPYDQRFNDKYSPLKYLGGLGPYSSRTGDGISTEVPEGCEVDQVVMLQRHGERYPSVGSVRSQRRVLNKIYHQHPDAFAGDLEFLNEWTYFLEHEGDAALETMSGPYAGLADLFEKGTAFGGRYGHLWDGQSKVPLFASGSERVIQSARAFGQGFLGYNFTDIAAINIIPEDEEAGANALSPYYCAYEEVTECPLENTDDYDGVGKLVYPEFDVAAIRLNKEHGLHLTGRDIPELFEIGAFDVSVRGDSPWLDVFTREEWLAWNYRQGAYFQCYWGAQSKIGRANGANWANATTLLLTQGPEDSGLPLSLNFAHDSDITSFLGGAGILTPLKPYDPRKVTFDNRWELNDVVPMGAQLVIERLKCKAPGLTNNTNLVSSNASLPDSYLNNSFGAYPMYPGANVSGYFNANYTNSSFINTTTFFPNNSGIPYVNTTMVTPLYNETLSLFNATNGSFVMQNVTSVYGFNLTQGTTDGTPEADAVDSVFVRVLLNDAVVPLDDCYDGPGYSCSLDNWTAKIAIQAVENNYQELCQPAAAGYPEWLDFYWNYNATTTEDVPSYIPWQGSSLE